MKHIVEINKNIFIEYKNKKKKILKMPATYNSKPLLAVIILSWKDKKYNYVFKF